MKIITSILIILFILQITQADTQPSDPKTPDNLLSSSDLEESHHLTNIEIPANDTESALELVPPPPAQENITPESDAQTVESSWFGTIQAFARNGLDSAKEVLSNTPDFIVEHATTLGENAKRVSDVLLDQASEMKNKAIEIYDQSFDSREESTATIHESSNLNQTSHQDQQNFTTEAVSNDTDASKVEEQEGILNLIYNKVLEISDTIVEKAKAVEIPETIIDHMTILKEKSQNLTETASDGVNSVAGSLLQTWSTLDFKGTFSNIQESAQEFPEKLSKRYREFIEGFQKNSTRRK